MVVYLGVLNLLKAIIILFHIAELKAFLTSSVTNAEDLLASIAAFNIFFSVLIAFIADIAFRNLNCLSEKTPFLSVIGTSICLSVSHVHFSRKWLYQLTRNLLGSLEL